jgi:hypothetical protein
LPPWNAVENLLAVIHSERPARTGSRWESGPAPHAQRLVEIVVFIAR